MHDCMAKVGAMATGTTVDDFKAFAANYSAKPCGKPPYSEIHFYAYLLSRGFLCGYQLAPPDGNFLQIPDAPVAELGLAAHLMFAGQPALVISTSPDPSWLHALYWDGAKIIDPNGGPEYPPSRYKIKTWTPIYRISDDAG